MTQAKTSKTSLYEKDYVAWADQQALLQSKNAGMNWIWSTWWKRCKIWGDGKETHWKAN